MTGAGHHAAAVGGAVSAFLLSQSFGADPAWGIQIGLGCVAGGKAPDWLEIPLFRGQGRVIPHRRITHWVAGWIAILAASLMSEARYAPVLAGFALGCLIHLTGDFLTPMGIPVLHPWNRTRGLQIGQQWLLEPLWITTIWATCLMPWVIR